MTTRGNNILFNCSLSAKFEEGASSSSLPRQLKLSREPCSSEGKAKGAKISCLCAINRLALMGVDDSRVPLVLEKAVALSLGVSLKMASLKLCRK